MSIQGKVFPNIQVLMTGVLRAERSKTHITLFYVDGTTESALRKGMNFGDWNSASAFDIVGAVQYAARKAT